MFFGNSKIRFFKISLLDCENNYGKNDARKRSTINIQLTLPNSDLKVERFMVELE